MKNKSYISLMIWIVGLVLIGFLIGSSTATAVDTWYSTLNHAPLTPPNYVFGIAWTILYIMLGDCGWIIWSQQPFPELKLIKKLYVLQLLLNWSWTPLFFSYHLTGWSLVCIVVMGMLVAGIIYLAYPRVRWASLLLIPYFMWLLFATYLNFYAWQCN
jgi:benzodiazapine receptor